MARETITLFYVDRFEIEDIRAEREVPVLKGWTTNMLATREKLEMAKGRLHLKSSSHADLTRMQADEHSLNNQHAKTL